MRKVSYPVLSIQSACAPRRCRAPQALQASEHNFERARPPSCLPAAAPTCAAEAMHIDREQDEQQT